MPKIILHSLSRRALRFTVLAQVLMLAACTNLTSGPEFPMPESSLDTLQTWAFKGKLKAKRGTDAQTANISWTNAKEHYAIRLSGPFGFGSTLIEGNDDGVKIVRPGQADIVATSGQVLLKRALGIDLPIEALQSWVKGVPSKHHRLDALVLNTEGIADSFSQLGWQIKLSNHRTYGLWRLPGKLIATKDDLQLLIVMSVWQP